MCLAKATLRATILGEKSHPISALGGRHDRSEAHEDELVLTIDARLKRCGREMRLILPGTSGTETPRQDAALIKAVARGFSWYEQIISGKTATVKALAAEACYSKSHANRIIRCALLAPDIVEKILAGKQPPELNLKTLLNDIPVDWTEQRRVFGFARS